MKRLVPALVLLLLSFRVASAEPAIWEVRSPTARVYLFGTMHLLPKHVDWFTGKVSAAFADSSVVFEEADIGFDKPEIFSHIMNQAVSPDYDLWQSLPDKVGAKLRKLVQSCHLPANVVAHFRPWFAAQLPTVCAIMNENHGAGSMLGPESTLIKQARATGKRMDFFETAEQQIGYLSGASEKAQIEQLEQEIDEGGGDNFSGMETAWFTGDVPSIAKLMEKMRSQSTEFYNTLILHRNERFAARIADMLNGHDTVFVAIGAGHLAGPDSVQVLLAKQGVVSKRL